MKRFIRDILLMSALATALTACTTTSTQSPAATTAQTAAAPNWLFVVNAPSAKVTQVNGQYRLAMYNVADIRAFTDRPARKVRVMTAKEFVAEWNAGKDSFAADNPNAAIAAILDVKNHVSATDEFVVLNNPSYDGKTHVLFFDIKKLGQKTILKAGKLNDLTLFVDALQPCSGGAGCFSPGSFIG